MPARALEHFPVDVNRNGHRGFPRTRKSDSDAPDGNFGGRRWRRDTRRVRAVEIVEAGESAREAARILDIGVSTAIRWADPQLAPHECANYFRHAGYAK